jgi:PAS domain S-box-containing protein
LACSFALLCGIVYWQYLRQAAVRRSTADLRKRAERYRTVLHGMPEALAVVDLDANFFVDANDHALDLFSVRREDLAKLDPGSINPPLTLHDTGAGEQVRAHIKRALNGELVRFEWPRRDAQGGDSLAEIRLLSLLDGQQRLLLATFTDISFRGAEQ